jgi:nucleoside-diphosphate-sugar epimerase
MRVAIIGATGHIGSWLVPRLVRAGHDVIAISRGSRRPYHRTPEWDHVRSVIVDRSNEEIRGSFGETIASLDADVVIDLICFDLKSAVHLVDALRGRVRHLIHCGTLWVHGVPSACPYDERAAREPFGEYGVRKAEIEAYLLGEVDGFPVTILHPGHITGPGWTPINPAGNLDIGVFERLKRGEVLLLPDDGGARLQHVHVDDVAQAFELAITRQNASKGEAFHVAAERAITMRAYAKEAARWFGTDASIEFLPWDEWRATVSEGDAEITRDHMLHSPCASIAKAKELLGFVPRYSAVEAVHASLRAAGFV